MAYDAMKIMIAVGIWDEGGMKKVKADAKVL